MKKRPGYSFSTSDDLIYAMGLPDGCTIIFSDDGWNFSFDKSNHLIAKSASGPALSIEVHGGTQVFKEKFKGLFERHNQRAAC
ncbi:MULTISPECIES: hypothetical protein [Bartonella]|uniref:hypothetical protein n=1 Tax=Bartonella TaxID=773 RepID=UPI001ABD156E|nr:hypothetical protein [Bartonella capreoli]